MQTANRWAIVLGLFLAATWTSCKKDSKGDAPFVDYAVAVDGNDVTFTNETTGATSYLWDFGDGTTSTDASPSHTYPGKGKYVPTLYATSASGVKAEGSTVIHISKGSAVKLDDNSLSDWDTVTHNVVLAGPNAGNFIEAKYDYDANWVYVYFEQNTTQADGNIYDIYIDADNDATTGYATGDIPGGGYDVLLEGTVFGGWLDPYYFSGTDQASFSWSNASISEFFKVGTAQESGGVLKFEWAISRSKVRGLTGQGLKIGVQAAKSDWSAEIGFSPDQGSAPFFLDMSN